MPMASQQRRPSGLCINSTSLLAGAFLLPVDESVQQGQPAGGWPDWPLASPPSNTAGVHTGRRQSAAAGSSMLSPHGQRGSTCSSPKSPHDTATTQLKGLQRTPLPLILARMKVLLERLNMVLTEQGACPPAAATAQATQEAAATHPRSGATAAIKPAAAVACRATAAVSMVAAGKLSSSLSTDPGVSPGAHLAATQGGVHPITGRTTPKPTAAATPASPSPSRPASSNAAAAGSSSSPHGRSSSGCGRQAGGKRQPRGLIDVSTSGGMGQSIMQASAQSVLDELSVTLGFISEFLGSLHPDTRKALATVARLEVYKKDQMIYDIGDEPSHFYVILSGRVDLWSHPKGAHRPKSIVSVLKRGDPFGDQAIINGQPHGSAASPATNVTLLAITRQDFMTVLGSHFLDVAAELQQFLVNYVAPMAECDPGMVRRLCSTLVVEKPAAGQECSVHDDQVYFIQAGNFEVRLVDLQAHAAAQAALAAAVASASSALAIAPIPEHLQLVPGARYSGGGSSSGGVRRPASAPPGAQRPNTAPTAAAAAAAGASGAAAAGGVVAAGLELLQADLANCPTLGSEGVLASVRVKDGRLVGTQGLVKQLRKQQGTRVPYKVIAELGPGGCFGGGDAIFGRGPLQSALRVVAVGPDCAVVHAHLSSLEKHGGPALIKRLRDDAAFKLTYYLGRLGVVPPLGAAVGHPESALVADTAAAAAAEEEAQRALLSSRGPYGTCSAAAAGAAGCSSATVAAAAAVPSPGLSPGRGSGSTARSCPGSALGADAAGRGRRSTGSSPPAAARVTAGAAEGAVSPSRPGSASKAAAAKGIRRASSIGSAISSAWDDPDIGVMPPASGGSGAVASTLLSGGGAVAAIGATAAALGASILAGDSAGASLPYVPRAIRARQKRVHVPGSGVFGAGVMAALQHMKTLQAVKAAPVHAAAARDTVSTCSDHPSSQHGSAAGKGSGQRTARASVAAASGFDSTQGNCDSCTPAAAGPDGRGGRRSSICDGTAAGAGAGAGAPAGSSGSSAGVGGGRPGSACAGSNSRVGLMTAGGCGDAGTAADVYWQQPDHSSTATGTALSGLLSNLFTAGLQPLVNELDCLLSHTSHSHYSSPTQQQQRWDALQGSRLQDCQRPARPSSAAPRLQQPVGGTSSESPRAVQCSRQQWGSDSRAVQQPAARPGSASKAAQWGRTPQRQHQAGGLQPAVQQEPAGKSRPLQQQQLLLGGEGDVLQHKPAASLLAASVMWQRSSEAAFRPPLRQCLTSAEIAQQRSRGVPGGQESC